MKEIKTYYQELLSLDKNVERWEIKLVQISDTEFLAASSNLKYGFHNDWTKLEATTEQEAFDAMTEIIKEKHS